MDINQARELHFSRMQKALEEGLRAIESAQTPLEADVARLRAQQRMEELNRMWEETLGKASEVTV